MSGFLNWDVVQPKKLMKTKVATINERLTSSSATLDLHDLDLQSADLQHLRSSLQSESFTKSFTRLDLEDNHLQPQDSFLISQILSTNSFFKIINLHGNNLAAGIQEITKVLQTNNSVKSLDLGKNKINASGSECLAELIKLNSRIDRLDIGKNQLGSIGGELIGPALPFNISLKRLDISKNRIGSSGLQALFKGLEMNSSLEALCLSDTVFATLDCAALGEALKKNSTLQKLFIPRCSIDEFGMRDLSSGLDSNSQIYEIDLSENKIGANGAQYIANVISKNKVLQYLDLEDNQISTGFSLIAKAIGSNSSLVKIVLSKNQIASGFEPLSESLKTNKTLESLDLTKNDLRIGSKFLAEGLKRNSKLQKLYLPKTNLDFQGTKYLLEALQVNSSLKKLNLEENEIDSRAFTMDSIVMFQENKTLKTLHLSKNKIDHVGGKCIGDGLAKNSGLVKLKIAKNLLGVSTEMILISLGSNSTLKELDLEENKIYCSSVVAQSLRANTTLKKLNLNGSELPSGILLYCSSLILTGMSALGDVIEFLSVSSIKLPNGPHAEIADVVNKSWNVQKMRRLGVNFDATFYILDILSGWPRKDLSVPVLSGLVVIPLRFRLSASQKEYLNQCGVEQAYTFLSRAFYKFDPQNKQTLLFFVSKDSKLEKLPKKIRKRKIIIIVFSPLTRSDPYIAGLLEENEDVHVMYSDGRTIESLNDVVEKAKEISKKKLKRQPSASARLLVVGHGGVGKTMLLNSLGRKANFWTKETKSKVITSTIGFDTGVIAFEDIALCFSDFAGQVEYLSVHQHFIPESAAISLVVIAATSDLDSLRSQTRHWFQLLKDSIQNPLIAIVITKIDQVTNWESKQKSLTKTISELVAELHLRSQISKIYYASSITGQGINELKEDLHKEANNRKKEVPVVFNQFTSQLQTLQQSLPIIISLSERENNFSFLKLMKPKKRYFFNLFLLYQDRLGQSLYHQKTGAICTDPGYLSKAISLFLAPSEHFGDKKGGRSVSSEGIVTSSVAYSILQKWMPKLQIPEIHAILEFFQLLGVCRILDKKEAMTYGHGSEVFLFPELLPISDFPYLPPKSESSMSIFKNCCQCLHTGVVPMFIRPKVERKFFSSRDAISGTYYSMDDVKAKKRELILSSTTTQGVRSRTFAARVPSVRTGADVKFLNTCYQEIKDLSIIGVAFVDISMQKFQKFCLNLRNGDFVDPRFKSFRNVCIVKDFSDNIQFWFYADFTLFGIIRGLIPQLWIKSGVLECLQRSEKDALPLCPICVRFGHFTFIGRNPKDDVFRCGHKCLRDHIHYGYPLSEQQLPWSPLDPSFNSLPTKKKSKNLEMITLTSSDTGAKQVEFNRVKKMVENMLRGEKEHKGFGVARRIRKIIYFKNQQLEDKFKKEWDIMLARSMSKVENTEASDPMQWTDEEWAVLEGFEKSTCRISGNSGVNLITAWQGNSEEVNFMIASGGQLTKEKKEKKGITCTDEGYFGRGIYFSQFASYCMQYTSDECLLFHWVLMGNVFPVTQSIFSPDGLCGKPMKEGFDSHYVLVKRAGQSSIADVPKANETPNGDEIVIPNPNQCLPRYLVYFEKLTDIKKKKNQTTGTETPMNYRMASLILLWYDPNCECEKMITWIVNNLPHVVVERFLNDETINSWITKFQECLPRVKIIFRHTTLLEEAKKVLNVIELSPAAKRPILICTDGKESYVPQNDDHEKAKKSLKSNFPVQIYKRKFSEFGFSQNWLNLLNFCIPSDRLYAVDRNLFGYPPPVQAFRSLNLDFNILKVTITRGKKLLSCDANGKSDPYCVFGWIYSMPKSKGVNTCRVIHDPGKTEVKASTLSPVWEKGNSASYHFKVFPNCEFLIQVRDYDWGARDDSMGEVIIKREEWKLPEGKKFFDVVQGGAKKAASYGSIQVAWEFQKESL